MDNGEINYIVDKIKRLQRSISTEYYQFNMHKWYDEQNYEEEFPGWTEYWMKQRIYDLYYLILGFFEAKKMHESYKTFKEKFHKKINDKEDLLIDGHLHPEEPPELSLLDEFRTFLNPHVEFSLSKEENADIDKLESVLKNTNHILKRLDVSVTGEADIYKAVRWILGLYFPKTRAVKKASFIEEFKTYHPDILVPELKTAIEYKYVKADDKESDVENYIDEIKTDSVNYKNDYRYDNFIAVIYFNDSSITTPEKINACWNSKDFPDSWTLIISHS